MIEAYSLLDYAGIPNGVQVRSACFRNRNKVAAAIILKGDVQGLVNVANPMAKRLKKAKLVIYIAAQGKVAHIVQDRRDDATIGHRAGISRLNAPGVARDINEMLVLPSAGQSVRCRASIGKGAVSRIYRDQGINACANCRLQLVIGDLANDAMTGGAPCLRIAAKAALSAFFRS